MSSSLRREEQERELLATLAAELEDPDTSYEVFHKAPGMFTPLSVASTAPTAMLTQSFQRLTDSTSSDACVHRKWEELAGTWKTTAGAVAHPPSPQRLPLASFEAGESTQLMRLSAFEKSPIPSPSFNSSIFSPEIEKNTQLLRLSALSRSSSLSPSSPSFNPSMHSAVDPDFLLTTSPDSLEKPFRPYGFEWSSPREKTSNLSTYTNMCVFDRLYGQANIPTSPARIQSPPRRKTTKIKTTTKPIKSTTKKAKKPQEASTPNSEATRRTGTTTKKSKPAATAPKQPWKSSSKYARDFGSLPRPKRNPQLEGTKSRLFQPTAAFQASSTKKTTKKNKMTKKQPQVSPERRPELQSNPPIREEALASPPHRQQQLDIKTPSSPKRPHKAPFSNNTKSPPWKSPSRSPRSFGGLIQHDQQSPIPTIQLRMLRTELLKELMKKPERRQNQPEDISSLEWTTPLRPRFQLQQQHQSSHQHPDQLQIPTLLDPDAASYPLPAALMTANKNRQQQQQAARNHYSPLTAAGAMSDVQNKYKDSFYSIEQKHVLVQAYRQARHKVEQQQQHPLTPSLPHSSSWGSTTPTRSLRDKWKAQNNPMHQRHVAAKRIQHLWRTIAQRRHTACAVIQQWYRPIGVDGRRKANAARAIQIRWRYRCQVAAQKLQDRRAAEMLQLCWWRKLSADETTRVNKACTTKHAYSHIPLRVQQFVRESRQDRAVQAETAKILQLREQEEDQTGETEQEAGPGQEGEILEEQRQQAKRKETPSRQRSFESDATLLVPHSPPTTPKPKPSEEERFPAAQTLPSRSAEELSTPRVMGRNLSTRNVPTVEKSSSPLKKMSSALAGKKEEKIPSTPASKSAKEQPVETVPSPTKKRHSLNVHNVSVSRPVLGASGKSGDKEHKARKYVTKEIAKNNCRDQGQDRSALDAQTSIDVATTEDKGERALEKQRREETETIPNDDEAVAKIQWARPKLQVRHIDLSVGDKKVALEKQRWDEKISPTRPNPKSRKATHSKKASAPKGTKQNPPMVERVTISPDTIDLRGLYRKAFAMRSIELREMYFARIRAAKQLQRWLRTTSLLVWIHTNQRRRAATKIQAVYRGHRCLIVYQCLLGCAFLIQNWWRACSKGKLIAVVEIPPSKEKSQQLLPQLRVNESPVNPAPRQETQGATSTQTGASVARPIHKAADAASSSEEQASNATAPNFVATVKKFATPAPISTKDSNEEDNLTRTIPKSGWVSQATKSLRFIMMMCLYLTLGLVSLSVLDAPYLHRFMEILAFAGRLFLGLCLFLCHFAAKFLF